MITKRFSKLFQECVSIVISFTQKSYPLDVNQCPHQTTQYKFMMHYVKSGDRRRRGQLEQLAQKNAGTKSKHLRKLPVKQYCCVCVCVCVCVGVCGGCVCITTHLPLWSQSVNSTAIHSLLHFHS